MTVNTGHLTMPTHAPDDAPDAAAVCKGARVPGYVTAFEDGSAWHCNWCGWTCPPPEPVVWEPGDVDLTQLARYVCMLHADPHLRLTTGHAVLGAWVELTGAPDDETALSYARRLSDAADTDGTRVTAHVAPF